ncbi:hypothetical protein ElyMa_001701700 [Elysia marginata]|uniref:Uncharacterized protein n=1 Tax=Elysia marginata TaxID=1093978 RepID=A0AAV4JYH2_9GAST|nr:hypothetical protein ElyMa_001701700 [Elysia marginata]
MGRTEVFLLFLSVSILPRALSLSRSESGPDWVDIQPETGFHAIAKDIYLLSQSNFTNCVLRSRDPWVVIPLGRGGVKNLQPLAERLRGVAFFGTIDINRETTLLSELVNGNLR